MDQLERLVARLNAGAYLPPLPKEENTMAKAVKLPKGKEFTFTKTAASGKYPWDAWLNGDLLLLERSTFEADGKTVAEKKDFEVDTDAMVAKLKTAAKRRYKVAQVSKKDAEGAKLENALIIKGRDMTAEEKVAEDLRRAEQKAARAEEEGDEGDEPDTGAA